MGGIQNIAMALAVLIFTGQLSIDHRNKVEYIIVISSILFVWTFIYDFKRFKMDVDKIPKTTTQPVILNQINEEHQFNQNMMINQHMTQQVWTGQPVNTFESM